MLNNLVTTLDAEAKDDEEKFGHFSAWCNNEMVETSGEIEGLQSKIEDTKASLAALYSKKGELETSKAKLEADIDETQTQIKEATEKRNEEHGNFVTEQTDFDNAISSCEKAVTLLAGHYGDGSGPAEAVKPEFMSLMETIRKSVKALSVPLGSRHKGMSFLQDVRPGLRSALALVQGTQPSTINNDRYQAATGEATTIVDQIKVLGQTFAEDKQSAISEEERLQATYDNLMEQKSQMLTDLQKDLDGTTQRLAETVQSISEKEGVLARAQKMLADEQTYMSSLQENLKDMTEAFEHRKKDRADEKTAVTHALGVLSKYNKEEFLQKNSDAGRSKKVFTGLQLHQCKGCVKVSSMLMSKAKLFHSSMLEAAASASASLDALDDIIKNLDGLIERIDVEAQHELDHKTWCEKETGLTTKKREDNSQIVEDIKGILANLGEVVVEKEHGLDVNHGEITDEDMTWEDREKLRTAEHQEFEVDVEEHVEAIAALNEAINILAKYYASKKGAAALLQQDPGRGGSVVQMISATRHEFEVGKETLENDEEEAVKEYGTMRAAHLETEADLDEEKDTLTVEKQSTEQQIYQEEQDLELHKGEVVSAKDYLEQLGKSCYPLLMHYDERVRLRNEEKASIQEAIHVLKTEA